MQFNSKTLLILIIGNLVEKIAAKVDIHHFERELSSLLEKVYSERPYGTTFLQWQLAVDCVDENLQLYFKSPYIIHGSNETIYLKGNYSSEMLAIVCMKTINNKQILEKLALNLQHIRDTRIIVIVNEELLESNEEDLINLFEQCKKLKLLNVNLLHRDFHQTRLFHSYTPFPDFQLETRALSASEILFPYRLSDLKGKELVTLPDQVEPHTILYTDASGRQQISGYLGKLLRTFAENYNCSFKFPFHLSKDLLMHNQELLKYVRNETVDIAACLSTPQRELNTHEYSSRIEMMSILNMLPMEPPVPLHRLLMSVLSIEYALIVLLLYCFISLLLMLQTAIRSGDKQSVGGKLLQVFCNETALRGTLGQPFDMPHETKPRTKFTYTLLFLAGLFVSTTYSANLSHLITAPPQLKEISSFDDLLGADLKLLLPKQHIPQVKFFRGEQFWNRYKSIYKETAQFSEFINARDSFNQSYGYTVTTSVWPFLKERQRCFSRKLFRLSEELFYGVCFVYGIPINENSFYREPLNRLIGSVMDSGIYQHWYTMAFYDLLELKKISFKDFSTPRMAQPFQVRDFFWIWVFYCSSMCVSVLVFLIEKFGFRSVSPKIYFRNLWQKVC